MVDWHSKLLYSGAFNMQISAECTAHLFLETAWQYEGLTRQVISDWGSQFAATCTKELNKLLWIKGSLTTAYHLQSDGQTEQVNQEMEVYLQISINHYQNDSPSHGMLKSTPPDPDPLLKQHMTDNHVWEWDQHLNTQMNDSKGPMTWLKKWKKSNWRWHGH